MKINERIDSLRKLMKKYHLDAYLINGSDPHLSEYTPARWKTREWISGFTGSYGRVVVTLSKAALWTDSRYFLQAEKELQHSEIILMKDRVPDAVSYEEWILKELPENGKTAIDGATISIAEERKLIAKLSAKGITLQKDKDLLKEIWKDRPEMPQSAAYDYPLQYAGLSRRKKVQQIRAILSEKEVSGTVISMLDDLAWTFNIRGNDIDYTPLLLGYGYIGQQKSILFMDENKLSASFKNSLIADEIEIREYSDLNSFIRENKPNSLLIDPERTNSMILEGISFETNVVEEPSIPLSLKCIKNPVEIQGMKDAHRKDGLAMVNTLHWIFTEIGKREISEFSVCQKLKEFRSQQKNFVEESFFPIVGYAGHGAIVHYRVTTDTNSILKPEGLLLIDSGGQFLEGTTDITRTLSLGEPTEQQKTDFTLVLKGVIRLSKAIFPNYCKGSSLDILARQALWESFQDYGHGTGHGVGHFLCVHEGPVSIRQDTNSYRLTDGNIISNEPGLYKENEYGIRIENLILCKKSNTADFLEFETLTLCPIDRKLIRKDLLNKAEIVWINQYHKNIVEELGPSLDESVKEWLINQCADL